MAFFTYVCDIFIKENHDLFLRNTLKQNDPKFDEIRTITTIVQNCNIP
jgi:hypothetical protein